MLFFAEAITFEQIFCTTLLLLFLQHFVTSFNHNLISFFFYSSNYSPYLSTEVSLVNIKLFSDDRKTHSAQHFNPNTRKEEKINSSSFRSEQFIPLLRSRNNTDNHTRRILREEATFSRYELACEK